MTNQKIMDKFVFRAKLVAVFLRMTPFVRMVGLSGSVVQGRANKNSDIDFWVVTKKNRIWSGRFFVTLMVQVLGLRRTSQKIAGRICLNCYQTEDHLKVGPENLKNAKSYSNIYFLLGSNTLIRKYYKENRWFKKYVNSICVQDLARVKYQNIYIFPLKIIQSVFEFIYELLFSNGGEAVLKKYQTKKILENPLTRISYEGKIYISDSELRFHPTKKA